jgi:hypothetical protein
MFILDAAAGLSGYTSTLAQPMPLKAGASMPLDKERHFLPGLNAGVSMPEYS